MRKLVGRSLRIGRRSKIRRITSVGVCGKRSVATETPTGLRWSNGGPADAEDRHGKLAEHLLMGALADRRPPSDEMGPDTSVMTLVRAHLDRLAEEDVHPPPGTPISCLRRSRGSSSAGCRLSRRTRFASGRDRQRDDYPQARGGQDKPTRL